MAWTVTHADAFDPEYEALPHGVRLELLAATGLLESYGPALARP